MLMTTPAAFQPAQRQPITAWKLVVWAYRRQMVAYDAGWYCDADPGDGVELPSAFDMAQAQVAERNTTAHPDAHLVHSRVRDLRWHVAKLIVDSASAGIPPAWQVQVPTHRFVPMWKGVPGRIERVDGVLQVFGDVRRIWRRGNVVGHRVVPEGIPQEEADIIRRQARERYSLWWSGLRMVRDRLCDDERLRRWRVTEIGAPCEPWIDAALRLRQAQSLEKP